MGYNTKFSGELKFMQPLTMEQFIDLDEILEKLDIDLDFNKQKDALKWNGAEKTYDLEVKVNDLVDAMRLKYPEFYLCGELLAQGEEVGDVWKLVIENGRAVRQEITIGSELKKLNIPNPTALDMGEMFGIPQERRDIISKGMDEMVRQMQAGEVRMVYGSDVLKYIENLCQTTEELIWATSNHIAWMLRSGRMAKTEAEQNQMINKYGQPQNLK